MQILLRTTLVAVFLCLCAIGPLATAKAHGTKDGVPTFSEALDDSPLDLSAGYSFGRFDGKEFAYRRDTFLFGGMLLPTWWVSPYVDLRLGPFTARSDGEIGEGAELSERARHSLYTTGTFGSLVTLHRRGRLWLNLYGEFETSLGRSLADSGAFTLRRDGRVLRVPGLDESVMTTWRRWEIGLTAHVAVDRHQRVLLFGTVALDSHHITTSTNLKASTVTSLGELGITERDIRRVGFHKEYAPSIIPGIEISLTPRLRVMGEYLMAIVPHEGLAHGGNFRLIVNCF